MASNYSHNASTATQSAYSSGLQEKENNVIKVLILGETGVGKSTWINAIGNYLIFNSLDDAEISQQFSLIPSCFTITDENFKQRRIIVGTDANEIDKPGESATQDPKSYKFDSLTLDREIILIDTPGIGDTRGVDQDKENFKKILRFLETIDDLNGICVLLKPNNARLTILFRFCIKELLTHLHRSALNNIVFCFTNSRSTFYRPGDTLPALENLLKENPDVHFDLNYNRMFCLDNEAFRFLCASKQGVKFDEQTRRDFSASWKKSTEETNRLFSFLANLKPHNLKDTISLNQARALILKLTKPIAECSKTIQLNIQIIEDKKRELQNSELSEKELAKRLQIKGIGFTIKPLPQPTTVCTSTKCIDFFSDPSTGVQKTNYKTRCHEPCGLSNVTPEQLPNPAIRGCDAFQNKNNCRVCGCSWESHMHVTYTLEAETSEMIDRSVEQQIASKKSARDQIEIFIKSIESKKMQLESEMAKIRDVSVQFGCFLKFNAISVYNDALVDYLNFQIKEERGKVSNGGNPQTMENLETLLKQYTEERQILETAIQSQSTKKTLSPFEIKAKIEELYQLPLKGQELKALMEAEERGVLINTQSTILDCTRQIREMRNTRAQSKSLATKSKEKVYDTLNVFKKYFPFSKRY